MALETGNYIASLVATNPPGTDPKSQGDDHLRLIKTALLNCFPGFTGSIMVTGTDGGAANAYTLTSTPALLAYSTRMIAVFSPTADNTGASTLNISGLGVKDLKSVSGAALLAGELVAGIVYAAFYNGTEFRLLSITKGYADQLAFSAALPSQTGNAGKFITTNGTVASWTDTFTIPITFQSRVDEAKGADIASAATVNLSTATGNLIHITGTTTITAITIPSGAERTLVFDGALTLTHNATTLILPTGANITTVAGDSCQVRGDGSGNARVVSYQRADGTALSAVPPGSVLLATLTPSGSSNVLESLNVFSSTYDNYAIIIKGIKPSADDTLLCRFANAGAVDTGVKYYDTSVGGAAGTTAAAFITLGAATATGKGFSTVYHAVNANDTTNVKTLFGQRVHMSAAPSFSTAQTAHAYDSANAASGIRFYWTTGTTNFSAVGAIYIFGIKK